MPMFHRALAGLYDLAEQVPHGDFLVEALSLLQPWINFDGAVLGVDEIDAGGKYMVPAHIHLRDRVGPLAGGQLPAVVDFAVKGLLTGLESPIQWDRHALRQHGKLRGLEDMVRPHELQHLVLFGERPSAQRPGRWLALYRERNTPFNTMEVHYLHAAWFHVARALDINLSRMLDRHDPDRARRASALINPDGAILVADCQFHRLLCREWPDYQGKRIPPAAMNSLVRGKSAYRGRYVEILVTRHPGYILCLAAGIDARNELTPSEYMVARRYAAGMRHKEIARELGLSPHTVRNQIAHLYLKLGIHDKAALAQYLVLNAGQRKQPARTIAADPVDTCAATPSPKCVDTCAFLRTIDIAQPSPAIVRLP